jgi:hypothetical protein
MSAIWTLAGGQWQPNRSRSSAPPSRLPVLMVPVVIQRKQATRPYRLFWNSLLREFEPLACSRCYRPTFSPTFTNETVDALCSGCAKSAG